MNIATTLRYVDLEKGDAWDKRYYTMHDYNLMANKYGIGLVAIMSEYDIENICKHCDGLIIPGSSTRVDPSYYGEEPLEVPEPVDEYALDAKLMKYFIDHKKPVFGVCGGHQAINIYLGGTISEIKPEFSHLDKPHMIDIKENSFVYDVFKKTKAEINSYHCWEIARLAEGLDVVATSPDGVIEAIECKERKLFATQWHPEQSFHTGDPLENKIFENFFRCCEENR